MTLPEIAKAALPGLPSSRQGLEKRADAEGWAQRNGLCRKRKGSGGGVEYSVDLLPLEARQELVERAGVFSSDIEPARTWTDSDPLSREERDRSDAKLHVLALFDAFRLEKDLSHRDARQLFSTAWKAGTIKVPDWVREIVPSVSKWSLDNWPKIRREQGDDALGLDQRGRPGRIDSAADGQARMRLTALIAANEFLTGEQIKDYMRETFDDELGDVSTRTVQRTRARIEKEDRNVLMRIRDPDAWRSKVEVSGTAMITAAGLNDLWEMDASPADVMLRGKRRHSIYMSVDVWARRTIITVTQTPRAAAVAALTRKCLIEWGIPSRIKTDQGSDFTARAIARLMDDLKVEHDLCDAFSPKQKPHVERAIETFQHDLRMCPGFIGHSVADRKKIEGRKAFSARLGTKEEELFEVDMDLAEFQAWCDEWASLIYANRDHGGLKKPTKTPVLKAASWTGEIRRIADPDALNILIAPIPDNNGKRTVQKNGIRIDNEFYMTKAAQPGEEVFVRMDPSDAGRIMLFSLDGETFLGLGICPPLAGEDPVKVALEMKAAQRALENEKRAEIRKEMRQLKPRDVMEAVRNQAKKKAAALVPFERPATPYSTPALDAAKAAGAALIPQTQDYTPREREQLTAAVISMPKAPAAPRLTPQQKMRWALDLEDRIAAGGSVDPEEMARLQGFQETPDYRAWMKIIKKEGRQMLAG